MCYLLYFFVIFFIIVNSTFFFTFYYFLANLVFCVWLYDEARVLIIWIWGVSPWVGESCKVTFSYFGKFFCLGCLN